MSITYARHGGIPSVRIKVKGDLSIWIVDTQSITYFLNHGNAMLGNDNTILRKQNSRYSLTVLCGNNHIVYSSDTWHNILADCVKLLPKIQYNMVLMLHHTIDCHVEVNEVYIDAIINRGWMKVIFKTKTNYATGTKFIENKGSILGLIKLGSIYYIDDGCTSHQFYEDDVFILELKSQLQCALEFSQLFCP